MNSAAIDYDKPIRLSRTISTIVIPEGSRYDLEAGTEVYVTQALGGTVTVNAGGILVRVSPQDVDALGFDPVELPAQGAEAREDGSVDESLVWEQMKTCYDPEIPINVVDLGLVYKCEIERDNGDNVVNIEMTLTAPGCGMGPFLIEDVRDKVAQVPNVDRVEVELVFDPPWSYDMMSEAARLETGMF